MFIFGPSLAGAYRDIACAHVAVCHIAIGVKRPVFIAAAAIPLAGFEVLPFALQPDRNPVVRIGPEFLRQLTVQLHCPGLFEEVFDSRASLKRVQAAPPHAFRGYGVDNLL